MHIPKLTESFKAILDGVRHFQDNLFEADANLFESLSEGQQPKVLFITCSDSRIDTSLLTQSKPGDLFIIRNAGNIVPPHGATCGGITATIEYAVSVLNVEHVVICGHSKCGAMNAVLHPELTEKLPAVRTWLSYAEATRSVVVAKVGLENSQAKVDLCAEENVMVQLTHLRTLPSVAAKLSMGELSLHGWMYHFETGLVTAFDPAQECFRSLDEVYNLATV